MAIEVMTKVIDRFPLGGNEYVVALMLANHAHKDGTHIFPGVESLARDSKISVRTVQRILKYLTATGWLQKVGNANYGRGLATTYRINKDWIDGDHSTVDFNKKGDKLSPFCDEERVTNPTEKGDTAVSQKGETAVSAQPSLTKYINRQTSSRACAREVENSEDQNLIVKLSAWLAKRGVITTTAERDPVKREILPAIKRWADENIPPEVLEQCIKTARGNKPPTQRIHANYLDSIVAELMWRKTHPSKNWMMSEEATVEMADEYDLYSRPGESWYDFRQRIQAAIDAASECAAA